MPVSEYDNTFEANPTKAMQNYADQAKDMANRAADEASSMVDRFVNYARENPVQTALATAGVAFVAGAIILGPRFVRSSRRSDLHKVLDKAAREAKRVRSDLPSLNQVSSWVKSQLPG